MGPQVETQRQNCPNWVWWTFSAYWKPGHRKSMILQHIGYSTWTPSGILEHRYPISQSWKIYQPPCKSTYQKSHWLTDNISYTTLKIIDTHLNYNILYMITLITTSSTRENGESVLFQPVLKAYPTCHSWLITVHISLGHLEHHWKSFNRQLDKTCQYLQFYINNHLHWLNY